LLTLLLASTGYAAVLFDYRTFGGSDGLPRQLVDNVMQVDDYQNALKHIKVGRCGSLVILFRVEA